MRIFCLTRGPTRSWRNGDAQCCQLSKTPLATFFPSKKHPNLVSENHRYCRARSCSPSARTHLSLSASAQFLSQRAHTSLSLCVCSVQRAHTPLSLSVRLLCSARAHTSLSLALSASAQFLFSDRQILCCFSNFTCKYSRNHSTAIVIILCVFDFIRRRCDYQDFFVQMNILEGRSGYAVLLGRVSVTISYSFHCLTTETVKYINANSFTENLASSEYSMWAKIWKQM